MTALTAVKPTRFQQYQHRSSRSIWERTITESSKKGPKLAKKHEKCTSSIATSKINHHGRFGHPSGYTNSKPNKPPPSFVNSVLKTSTVRLDSSDSVSNPPKTPSKDILTNFPDSSSVKLAKLWTLLVHPPSSEAPSKVSTTQKRVSAARHPLEGLTFPFSLASKLKSRRRTSVSQTNLILQQEPLALSKHIREPQSSLLQQVLLFSTRIQALQALQSTSSTLLRDWQAISDGRLLNPIVMPDPMENLHYKLLHQVLLLSRFLFL